MATIGATIDRVGELPAKKANNIKQGNTQVQLIPIRTSVLGQQVKSGYKNTPVTQAHYDIPCGIYNFCSAQFAALSVARFLDQIAELSDTANSGKAAPDKARLIVAEKEKQAARVKAEVTVIWGDYFNSPRLELSFQLHGLAH